MIFYGTSKDLSFKPDNKKAWLDYLEKNDGKKLVVEINLEKGKRTLPQNDSLHLWYELVAKELNEKGLTVQEVLKKTIEIDWNAKRVKEIIWRSVQEAITSKKSTTELNKSDEIDIIYEHINRFLADKCDGIHVPFPKKEKEEFDVPVAYPINNLGESKF